MNTQKTSFIEKARSQDSALWKRVASDLAKASRRQRVVNLSRISLHSKEGETVVVPGKVLGTGDITHKITVAAYSYSQSAIDKLKNANCTVLTLEEFMAKNPKGKGRVIG